MGAQNISIFLVFFVLLLVLVLVLSKYLHDRPFLSSILPEAAMVLAVGIVAGFFIHLVIGKRIKTPIQDDDNIDGQEVDNDLSALLSFSPEIFFIALLPPIIFNSGLRIGALFLRHITPIVMFAILGTAISAVGVAFLLQVVCHFNLAGNFHPTFAELLTFGALISSTDPVSTLALFQAKRVDPQLFYLVFGESVLNDALAILLFMSFSKLVARENDDAARIAIGCVEFLVDLTLDSIGSVCLGAISGLGTAMLFKQVDMRQHRLVEISLYLLLVYVPFLLAEILELSGIVTILFTGIASNRYVVPNLSPITKMNADMLFRLLAHLAETSIFLELGLSVFGLIGHWNWAFIGWSLLACLIARALNVYPIAFLFNRLLLWGAHDSDDDSTELAMRVFRNVDKIELLNVELSRNRAPTNRNDFAERSTSNLQNFSFQTAASDITETPLRRKDLKIRRKTQHMLWFSGLRGAVAYACVRTFPDDFGHRKDFTMTTMAIVLMTVYVLGGTTEFVLSFLKINVGVDEDTYMRQSLREPVVSTCIADIGLFQHKSALLFFFLEEVRPLTFRFENFLLYCRLQIYFTLCHSRFQHHAID